LLSDAAVCIDPHTLLSGQLIEETTKHIDTIVVPQLHRSEVLDRLERCLLNLQSNRVEQVTLMVVQVQRLPISVDEVKGGLALEVIVFLLDRLLGLEQTHSRHQHCLVTLCNEARLH